MKLPKFLAMALLFVPNGAFAIISSDLSAAQIREDEPPETGSRLKERDEYDGRQISENRGRKIVHHVARCSVKKNPSRIRSLIQTRPGSKQEIKVIRATINTMSRCFPTTVKATFSPSLFRGSLAEYLYKHDYGDLGWAQVNRALRPVEYQSGNGVSANRAGLANFAKCVIDKDPTGAAEFMSTEVETKAEMEGLKALVPHMGPCLPSNVQLAINPGNIRPVFAEELYRYADVQAQGELSVWAVASENKEAAE